MKYCTKYAKQLIDKSVTCNENGNTVENSDFNVAQRRKVEKIFPVSTAVILDQISTQQAPQPQSNKTELPDLSSIAAIPQADSNNTEPIDRSAKYDNISAPLCVLSAFVPVFGLFYWLLRKKATPLRAMACGFSSICGAVYIAIFFFIIMGFLHN